MAEAQMLKKQTMSQQKVQAYIQIAQKSDTFWAGLIIFLGALMLLSVFPFYPTYIIFFLAAACALMAIKSPPFGVIAGVVLAFPTIIYQSSIFGWVYILIMVLVMFEAFEDWLIIAALEIIALAPFAFSALPFSGYISLIGMGIGALHFGSRKSLAISLTSITLILLLSSIWLVQNTAYMPIKMDLYQPPRADLLLGRPIVDLMNIPKELNDAVTRFLTWQNLTMIGDSLTTIGGDIQKLLLNDSLLPQIVGWGATLFLLGFIPARIKKYPQTIAALSLLTLLPVYFIIGMIYGAGFRIEFAVGIIVSIAVLAILEYLGVNISKESEIERKEKMKAYGKFGMSDISLSGEEKSMNDVGGYEDVKTELRDSIMMPLEKKEIAYTYGIKPPAGILLFGPPGTGKTMLMRALAKELKYNFIEVRCSQILSQWYGESEKNVDEVFQNARKNAPTILFFDEIDSIAKKRSVMGESMDTVGPRVLSELLQQMDGASKAKGAVMVIGATNLPNELDPAILRPGRLDKIIYMHLPDPAARRAIFELGLKKLPVAEDVNRDFLVKKTERFSGADLKNIITEAKGLAAKEASAKGEIVPISMSHFQRILDNVKPSTSISQLEIFEQFRLDFERRSGSATPKEEAKAEAKAELGWKDVAGLDEVKEALLEAIELPLLHEEDMKKFNVRPSKGILLFGPPGTGKTLIIRAAANELNSSFQTMSAADVMKKGYTEAVNIIKETFNRARENTPAIIFIDEIETFAPARSMGGGSEIIGQFLTEMDGIKSLKGVVVLAATNKPELMDPAIMRPGRFDKIFYIPPPDENGRKEIFRIHLGEFADKVDLGKVAIVTKNFSGADIAEICRSVKLKALKDKIAGRTVSITTNEVMEVIKNRRPSITNWMLGEYEKFLQEYGERR